MSARFRVVGRARGQEGAERAIWSALSLIVAGGAALLGTFAENRSFWLLAGLYVVAMISAWFLLRTIAEMRRDEEWEFSVEDNFLRWRTICRDRATLDGEIPVSEIKALIYHSPGDGPFASLSIEFCDGSTRRLPPLAGILSNDTLRQFINFWQSEYAELPIRNLPVD